MPDLQFDIYYEIYSFTHSIQRWLSPTQDVQFDIYYEMYSFTHSIQRWLSPTQDVQFDIYYEIYSSLIVSSVGYRRRRM